MIPSRLCPGPVCRVSKLFLLRRGRNCILADTREAKYNPDVYGTVFGFFGQNETGETCLPASTPRACLGDSQFQEIIY